MKGSTHLSVGAVIGGAAALYDGTDFQTGSMLTAIAALSALAADLDGRSMLSSKLDKTSRIVRNGIIGLGLFLLAYSAYIYVFQSILLYEIGAAAVAVVLLGLLLREGWIRNFLLSLIGTAMLLWGWKLQLWWLLGLGLFVGWAPWLKHRGFTHTVWALALWWWIGSGLETGLGVNGITWAATAGYASHLVLDTLTPQGIRWFYPVYKKTYKLPLR